MSLRKLKEALDTNHDEMEIMNLLNAAKTPLDEKLWHLSDNNDSAENWLVKVLQSICGTNVQCSNIGNCSSIQELDVEIDSYYEERLYGYYILEQILDSYAGEAKWKDSLVELFKLEEKENVLMLLVKRLETLMSCNGILKLPLEIYNKTVEEKYVVLQNSMREMEWQMEKQIQYSTQVLYEIVQILKILMLVVFYHGSNSNVPFFRNTNETERYDGFCMQLVNVFVMYHFQAPLSIVQVAGMKNAMVNSVVEKINLYQVIIAFGFMQFRETLELTKGNRIVTDLGIFQMAESVADMETIGNKLHQCIVVDLKKKISRLQKEQCGASGLVLMGFVVFCKMMHKVIPDFMLNHDDLIVLAEQAYELKPFQVLKQVALSDLSNVAHDSDCTSDVFVMKACLSEFTSAFFAAFEPFAQDPLGNCHSISAWCEIVFGLVHHFPTLSLPMWNLNDPMSVLFVESLRMFPYDASNNLVRLATVMMADVDSSQRLVEAFSCNGSFSVEASRRFTAAFASGDSKIVYNADQTCTATDSIYVAKENVQIPNGARGIARKLDPDSLLTQWNTPHNRGIISIWETLYAIALYCTQSVTMEDNPVRLANLLRLFRQVSIYDSSLNRAVVKDIERVQVMRWLKSIGLQSWCSSSITSFDQVKSISKSQVLNLGVASSDTEVQYFLVAREELNKDSRSTMDSLLLDVLFKVNNMMATQNRLQTYWSLLLSECISCVESFGTFRVEFLQNLSLRDEIEFNVITYGNCWNSNCVFAFLKLAGQILADAKSLLHRSILLECFQVDASGYASSATVFQKLFPQTQEVYSLQNFYQFLLVLQKAYKLKINMNADLLHVASFLHACHRYFDDSEHRMGPNKVVFYRLDLMLRHERHLISNHFTKLLMPVHRHLLDVFLDCTSNLGFLNGGYEASKISVAISCMKHICSYSELVGDYHGYSAYTILQGTQTCTTDALTNLCEPRLLKCVGLCLNTLRMGSSTFSTHHYYGTKEFVISKQLRNTADTSQEVDLLEDPFSKLWLTFTIDEIHNMQSLVLHAMDCVRMLLKVALKLQLLNQKRSQSTLVQQFESYFCTVLCYMCLEDKRYIGTRESAVKLQCELLDAFSKSEGDRLGLFMSAFTSVQTWRAAGASGVFRISSKFFYMSMLNCLRLQDQASLPLKAHVVDFLKHALINEPSIALFLCKLDMSTNGRDKANALDKDSLLGILLHEVKNGRKLMENDTFYYASIISFIQTVWCGALTTKQGQYLPVYCLLREESSFWQFLVAPLQVPRKDLATNQKAKCQLLKCRSDILHILTLEWHYGMRDVNTGELLPRFHETLAALGQEKIYFRWLDEYHKISYFEEPCASFDDIQPIVQEVKELFQLDLQILAGQTRRHIITTEAYCEIDFAFKIPDSCNWSYKSIHTAFDHVQSRLKVLNRCWSVADAELLLLQRWQTFLQVCTLQPGKDESMDVAMTVVEKDGQKLHLHANGSPRRSKRSMQLPSSPCMAPDTAGGKDKLSTFKGDNISYRTLKVLGAYIAEERRTNLFVASAFLSVSNLFLSMLHHQIYAVGHKARDPVKSSTKLRPKANGKLDIEQSFLALGWIDQALRHCLSTWNRKYFSGSRYQQHNNHALSAVDTTSMRLKLALPLLTSAVLLLQHIQQLGGSQNLLSTAAFRDLLASKDDRFCAHFVQYGMYALTNIREDSQDASEELSVYVGKSAMALLGYVMPCLNSALDFAESRAFVSVNMLNLENFDAIHTLNILGVIVRQQQNSEPFLRSALVVLLQLSMLPQYALVWHDSSIFEGLLKHSSFESFRCVETIECYTALATNMKAKFVLNHENWCLLLHLLSNMLQTHRKNNEGQRMVDLLRETLRFVKLHASLVKVVLGHADKNRWMAKEVYRWIALLLEIQSFDTMWEIQYRDIVCTATFEIPTSTELIRLVQNQVRILVLHWVENNTLLRWFENDQIEVGKHYSASSTSAITFGNETHALQVQSSKTNTNPICLDDTWLVCNILLSSFQLLELRSVAKNRNLDYQQNVDMLACLPMLDFCSTRQANVAQGLSIGHLCLWLESFMKTIEEHHESLSIARKKVATFALQYCWKIIIDNFVLHCNRYDHAKDTVSFIQQEITDLIQDTIRVIAKLPNADVAFFEYIGKMLSRNIS